MLVANAAVTVEIFQQDLRAPVLIGIDEVVHDHLAVVVADGRVRHADELEPHGANRPAIEPRWDVSHRGSRSMRRSGNRGSGGRVGDGRRGSALSQTAAGSPICARLTGLTNGYPSTPLLINMIHGGTRHVSIFGTAKYFQYSTEAMTFFGSGPAWEKYGETKHGQGILIALGELILLNRHKHHDEQCALRKKGARLAGLTNCYMICLRKASMATWDVPRTTNKGSFPKTKNQSFRAGFREGHALFGLSAALNANSITCEAVAHHFLNQLVKIR